MPDRTTLVTTDRFSITVYIPPKNKLYFRSSHEWSHINFDDNEGVETQALSNYKHGFLTQGFPYTKSPFYVSPYFIKFKSNARIDSNYLMYNDFFHPNSYTTILALLNYDDTIDQFVPGFQIPIKLQNKDSLSINNLLEFIIVDSVQEKVEFADGSQLFVYLNISN